MAQLEEMPKWKGWFPVLIPVAFPGPFSVLSDPSPQSLSSLWVFLIFAFVVIVDKR